MKNLYPSYLIDKETAKYHIVVLIQKVPRKKIMSNAKHFAKKQMLKLFFHHLVCGTFSLQKIVC